MDDAVRPSQKEFDRVLRQSCKQWSAYINAADAAPLPYHCIDLAKVLGRTPSFLGHGLFSENDPVSFACLEKESQQGQYGLLVSGHSIWRTSYGTCDVGPRTIPLQLLLAVPDSLKVQFSDCAPLAEWPGIQGLSGNDEGNYIALLFLAWAYILSARWAELLEHSSRHDCRKGYIARRSQPATALPKQDNIGFDIGYDVNGDEARWWKAISSSGHGWKITVDYDCRTYLSPWSVSVSDTQYLGPTGISLNADAEPPSSHVALEYLARFCARHHLYGQCSASLAAALYIPWLSGSTISLPVPRVPSPVQQFSLPSKLSQPTVSHSTLVAEHSKLLPYYMTLSCNVWGMRSLLCSTFFNAEVECNLVSAWLNPAFGIIDPLIKEGNFQKLAVVLARRQPKIGALWLGAILVGNARSTLRDIRIGLIALDFHAAAWTGTIQSFMAIEPGVIDGETITREDECRLLFITGCDGYTRAPIFPWKPFGKTRLSDTEINVQQHARCNCHRLEYISCHWDLSNGSTLNDIGLSPIPSGDDIIDMETPPEHSPVRCSSGYSSQLLSEGATRGIFGWLRSTGYPACEKSIYQHSWIDIGSSDDEELDDDESGIVRDDGLRKPFIEQWIEESHSG
jgi:hypothetical protein